MIKKNLKKLVLLNLFLFVSHFIFAQTYLHGTSGIQGERVTDCLVSTCGGTYYDNGGSIFNYSNGISGGLYRVFCPTQIGQCVSVTFNSFALEGMIDPFGPNPLDCYYDYLTIGNGATQNSPLIIQTPSTTNSGRICGTPSTPFTITADNPSGCLTFRFTSDNTVTAAGWSASLNCVPCATSGNGPNGTDPNDCVNAIPVCDDNVITGNATGPGLIAEGCSGNQCPAGGENHTQWYFITIQQGGTLNWNLNPTNGGDDYDFAVYGPNVDCNNLGNPIRCSDAATTGNTGSTGGASDPIENVAGNGFVSQMTVNSGDTYYMVVDEWSANSGGGYTLTWGGTAILDCSTILPIKLLYFGAEYQPSSKDALITWGTSYEYLNSNFIIEKSIDGYSFDSIGLVLSKGNTTHRNEYEFIDKTPIPNGFTYYRLKWYDDGIIKYSNISVIAVNDPTSNGILIYPNPTSDEIYIKNYYDNNNYDLKIYNSLGQLLYKRNNIFIISNVETINISDYPKGIYYMELSDNITNKSFLIIKE